MSDLFDQTGLAQYRVRAGHLRLAIIPNLHATDARLRQQGLPVSCVSRGKDGSQFRSELVVILGPLDCSGEPLVLLEVRAAHHAKQLAEFVVCRGCEKAPPVDTLVQPIWRREA